MLLYRTIEFDTSGQLQKLRKIRIIYGIFRVKTRSKYAASISFCPDCDLFALMRTIQECGHPDIVSCKSSDNALCGFFNQNRHIFADPTGAVLSV